MTRCAFLGDEITGAGFRLAGARVHQPDAQEIPALLEQLLTQAELILMTPEIADALPPGRLQVLQRIGWPLVLVIPDARARHPLPDLATSLRRQLGLTE